MPTPAHKPTPETRELIAALVAAGVPVEAIATIIKLSTATVYKYYREELDQGRAIANGRVAQSLYRMAISGRNPAATFFWLKTRAGWREVGDEARRELVVRIDAGDPPAGPASGSASG